MQQPTRRGNALVGLPIAPAAALATVSALAADALDQQQRIIESLAPKDRPAYIQRLIAQQKARAGQSLGADVTGPVLTAFNAPTSLNLSKSAAPFKVAVKATDDMSGVTGFTFYAYGPSGQAVYVNATSYFPSTSFNVPGSINGLSRFIEPGTWNFIYGYGYDAAGNYSYFDQTALQALGNTAFTVVNNGGYDKVAPTLVDGKILTPTVSLSALVPGSTDAPPYVKIKVNTADTGNTAVSGVRQVYLYFCKVADPNVCIYPYARTDVTAQAAMTFNVGRQVSAANGNVTGTYELSSVQVNDHAGNYNYYQSTLFGGSTDFSTFFPNGTSIKLKP